MEKTIDFSKVILCRKFSILDYDQGLYKVSEKEMVKRYKQIGADVEKIVSSHKRQQENFQKIRQFFPLAACFAGETLEKKNFDGIDLVVVIGGDNYFSYVTHFLDKQKVVGLNADPQTSEGALLNFKPEQIESLVDRLKEGSYEIEDWTRLQATANDERVVWPALSEIFIGAPTRLCMSRYLIEFQGIKEEHKDSGLIIATGSGSTGWYKSASSCAHQETEIFPKTERIAKFVCTEPFFGRLSGRDLFCGTLEPGQVIKINWQGHANGILCIDSMTNYGLGFELDRGGKATVEISDKPLQVIA